MLQNEQNRLQNSLDGLIKSIEQLESSILLDVDEILSMMLNEIQMDIQEKDKELLADYILRISVPLYLIKLDLKGSKGVPALKSKESEIICKILKNTTFREIIAEILKKEESKNQRNSEPHRDLNEHVSFILDRFVSKPEDLENQKELAYLETSISKRVQNFDLRYKVAFVTL